MCPLKKKKVQADLTAIFTDLGGDVSITYSYAPREHSSITEHKSLKSSTWNC